eukprot:CAMPEP_0115880990 /NCGR_PEP_ID=MMETSP0287-20121206/28179_1 /TAXON_ID=412157 /ORGANISM="Chrysochromulina rotalis, Strain UIO044" /LENGTH=148 /DNA_ID=CAMNT_0003336865 /DNA_START=24 /DNA_END=467 /DNA_ORIENTATION=+
MTLQSNGLRERSWSAGYEAHSKKLTKQHRQSTRKIHGIKQMPSWNSGHQGVVIEKKGKQLVTVNNYKIQRPLGKGAFGEVFLARHGSDQFAVKVLRKSALKKLSRQSCKGPEAAWGRGRTIAALANVKTEIATMKKITHPNCVQIFDV